MITTRHLFSILIVGGLSALFVASRADATSTSLEYALAFPVTIAGGAAGFILFTKIRPFLEKLVGHAGVMPCVCLGHIVGAVTLALAFPSADLISSPMISDALIFTAIALCGAACTPVVAWVFAGLRAIKHPTNKRFLN
ncbi:hypothetical protein [Minwuia thermotolerans]|uniref:Uncharacterized protein n=1 Tax=Minwuia thermotolerans TaxID=2056226 RepID=A0A2M9FW54_9PROT|nr:hypothetical protein [Minwuia thermotolerans]PJK27687.1 hypothetical protein CVT23_20970 [Minwuia thermotolerans]